VYAERFPSFFSQVVESAARPFSYAAAAAEEMVCSYEGDRHVCHLFHFIVERHRLGCDFFTAEAGHASPSPATFLLGGESWPNRLWPTANGQRICCMSSFFFCFGSMNAAFIERIRFYDFFFRGLLAGMDFPPRVWGWLGPAFPPVLAVSCIS